MPEPQSTTFFLLLMATFGALMWWLAVAKQLVFRVLAACLAFIPAMMFGVAAVNKYYDYYQNWNAAISDLSGRGAQAPEMPAGQRGNVQFSTFLGRTVDTSLARQQGFTLPLTVPGKHSHITRHAYVYLPPQYFRTAYRSYRFPVIELIHGFPGQPQDWITVMGVNMILSKLVSAGLAKPAVLVMPDANGGNGVSLQCLNQVNGPQDATYLAKDVPTYIARMLRVAPRGRAWGIAGYSEGGFCAANLGLQYGRFFGFSGVLSGYFKPSDNQQVRRPHLVNPFGGNAALRRRNTPDDLVGSLPPGAAVPQFWLGVGSKDRLDLKDAQVFEQLLQVRQPGVTLKVVPGGGHTMFTWRSLVGPMLEWMTPRLAARARVDAELAKAAHRRVATTPSPAATPPRPAVKPSAART